MTNSFPPVPSGLQLQSVTYQVVLPAAITVTPTSPFNIAGVATSLQTWFNAGSWGTRFTFSTPGDAGSFDQAAVEQVMASWLDDVASVFATIGGVPLADVQAGLTVQRFWQWSDGGTGSASWSDQMTYPLTAAKADADGSASADSGVTAVSA